MHWGECTPSTRPAMKREKVHPVLVIALLIGVGPSLLEAQNRAPLEVLYGFTLIDGRGGPPIPDAAIAVRGNEILTISTRLELLSGPNAPMDAIVTNLGGGYVIPGLIDSHVHLATVPNRDAAENALRRMLFSGITAVRDMAGDGRALASLARDSRLGQIAAPDVYFSALMSGPSFLDDPRPQSSAAGEVAGEVSWMQAITPETDLVRAVARAKGTYATGVKIYANLEPAEVAAITSEAHAQDLQVWAHSMVFPTRPMDVVNAGVDVISHACRLAWEGMADAPTEYHHDEVPAYGNFTADSPIFTQLFEAMRREGTMLDATLAMYSQDRPNPVTDHCDTGFARSLVARAHREGIPIVAGTDFNTPADDPYPALVIELEELVDHAGMSPAAALASATSVAARAIGIEETHGSLGHGRPVTFVLLQDDPLADISNLRTVRAVWKNGERFDRSVYRPRTVAQDVEVTAVGPQSPEQTIDQWLSAWRRYDSALLSNALSRAGSLTYLAHDREGPLEGFAAVEAYYAGLGFRVGGRPSEGELWLENTVFSDQGDDVVAVSGVWRFGNRVTQEGEARGPITLIIRREPAGYRISHVNMANYPR